MYKYQPKLEMIDQTKSHVSDLFTEYSICFNPNCRTPLSRLTIDEYDRCHYEQCSRWFIQASLFENDIVNFQAMLGSGENQQKKEKQLQTFLEVKDFPMQCIARSRKAEKQLKLKLKSYMKGLQQRIAKKLTILQNIAIMNIDQIFEPMQEVHDEIDYFLKSCSQNHYDIAYKCNKINEIVNGVNFQKFQKLESSVIFPEFQKAEQKIIASVTELSENILCQKSSIVSDLDSNTKVIQNLAKYLKDTEDDHNKKLSKLSSLLKIDQKLIYEKFPKGQSNYEYLLKCPLCSVSFLTEKRKQVMLMLNGSFADHLIQKHKEDLRYQYTHLITSEANFKVTVDEILYKITNYSYEAVQFVTKSARKFYNLHYSNRKRLSVDLWMKGQQRAPISFIELVEPHEQFVVIFAVSYAIKKSGNPLIQKKPVYIFNSNITDVYYLRRLCSLLNIKNIKIVTERRSEEQSLFENNEAEITTNIKIQKKNEDIY